MSQVLLDDYIAEACKICRQGKNSHSNSELHTRKLSPSVAKCNAHYAAMTPIVQVTMANIRKELLKHVALIDSSATAETSIC